MESGLTHSTAALTVVEPKCINKHKKTFLYILELLKLPKENLKA